MTPTDLPVAVRIELTLSLDTYQETNEDEHARYHALVDQAVRAAYPGAELVLDTTWSDPTCTLAPYFDGAYDVARDIINLANAVWNQDQFRDEHVTHDVPSMALSRRALAQLASIAEVRAARQARQATP